jgi:hypothetical protein
VEKEGPSLPEKKPSTSDAVQRPSSIDAVEGSAPTDAVEGSAPTDDEEKDEEKELLSQLSKKNCCGKRRY